MSQYCVIELELKTTIAKVVKIACYGTQGFLLLMMDNIPSGKGVFQSLHVA